MVGGASAAGLQSENYGTLTGRKPFNNEKLKTRLGWGATAPTAEGLRRFFQSCVQDGKHA